MFQLLKAKLMTYSFCDVSFSPTGGFIHVFIDPPQRYTTIPQDFYDLLDYCANVCDRQFTDETFAYKACYYYFGDLCLEVRQWKELPKVPPPEFMEDDYWFGGPWE